MSKNFISSVKYLVFSDMKIAISMRAALFSDEFGIPYDQANDIDLTLRKDAIYSELLETLYGG